MHSLRNYTLMVFSLWVMTAGAAFARKICEGHGGFASCDRSHQVVCTDGTLDEAFYCGAATKGKVKIKRWKRELKLKPSKDRGQILQPGQTPPSDTLEESYREMNR